jgi:esterase/lipase
MTRCRIATALSVGLLLLVSSACAGSDQAGQQTPPKPFEAHRDEALERLERDRAFQGGDRSAELSWNTPMEWRPDAVPAQGVLLVHGLGDSPWSFRDIGERLAARGFLVRTVLLPGHGTRPEDLLDVELVDWRRVVQEQIRDLQGEVTRVYLAGFSLGANLVFEYAQAHAGIAGLLLFSPAFRSDEVFDWLTPYIGWFRPWLLDRDEGRAQNLVRYMVVPTNGFAQYYLSSRGARRALDRAPFDRPVLMVVAENDSVLDTAYLSEVFQTRFTHPASRLIWYGSPPAGAEDDPRILVRPDSLPELRISQFSHMAIMFSPDNPLYGRDGSLRICSNRPDRAATLACEQGAPAWYSDWGYEEAGKIHARLTFNPYFDWQMQVVEEVLGETPTAAPR